MLDEKRNKLKKSGIPTNNNNIIHITKKRYPIKIAAINILFHQLFFFFYNNDLQLETKNKPKTYNSAPISMLCDVGGKLNVKNTKYNIKIYLS